jgi:hypothetical protein
VRAARRRQHPLGWLIAAAIALSTSVPQAASAQTADKLSKKKLSRRKAKLATHRGWVTMTVSYRDVVNSAIRRKLLSGLPTVIAARTYVFPDKGARPVALGVKTCRVVFDLWDEVFRIDLQQGGRGRQTVAVNVEGVLRRCAEARRQPIVAQRSLSAQQPYFMGVMVEINPLSKEMMERIKRWVSRPKGAGTVGPGDSLFGSFVGLFITHVPDADRAITFRTQVFVPAALPVIPVKKGDRRASR